MSGTINLPYYPSSNRTPGFFADIDGSNANTALFQQRTLVTGYMLPSGTAIAAGSPGATQILVQSLAQVGLLTGVGSMIYEMVKTILANDPFGELWILPLPNPTGTAATGTLALTGTAAQSGLFSPYFGGIVVPTPVYAGDTAAAVAARLLGLMASYPDLAVSGAVTGSTLTLTALHPGLQGNDIAIQTNFLGAAGGEADVPGLTYTITPMATGTGTPANLSAALATLAEQTFDFICCPFTDPTSLNALDAFLAENATGGRWSWLQMLFGGYFTAARGTAGTLATFGMTRNGKFGSCLMVLPAEPDPIWLHAADYISNITASLRSDPGVPLQFIVLGTKAAPVSQRLTRSLRNTLLYDGISTKFVNDVGQNVLERAITMYRTNIAGAPDNSFLDVETIFSLAYLIRRWQQRMQTLNPRKKLAIDGTPVSAGSNTVTSQTIKYQTIAWYQSECDAGNAQDPKGFAAAVKAMNAGNGLVKELLPFILMNQLRQIGALAQFTKP